MGQLTALGGLPAAAILAVAGFLAAGAGGQDVADCSWQPEEDQLLTCHLKTLQAGPAVIPQVPSNHLLFQRSLISMQIYLNIVDSNVIVCFKFSIRAMMIIQYRKTAYRTRYM